MTAEQEYQSGPPAGEISRLAEHLFRHESGKLISVLTGLFGIERLQLAEDVVQEALVRALQTWPYYGIPRNPAGWLTQTAKNLARDVLRRENIFARKEAQVAALIEQDTAPPSPGEALHLDQEIEDDRLRMMFACCHPVIPQEAQVALALKTLCGFSSGEIARAFLSSEAAIEKRLTRARQKIREARIAFEIPAGEELARRLEAVLQTLYLLFNEGYKASEGERLVREELCREAIRLGELLARHPAGGRPQTHALLALMCLNGARLGARVDAAGDLLRLKEQDRARWDREMIARGMFHLTESATGSALTPYHLQAGIAACHCAAPDFASTDWRRILGLYDRLAAIDGSPVVALNRVVALAYVQGAEAAIQELQNIPKLEALQGYYLYYAVLAEFQEQLGQFTQAAGCLRKALELTRVRSEQSFLHKRLRECESKV